MPICPPGMSSSTPSDAERGSGQRSRLARSPVEAWLLLGAGAALLLEVALRQGDPLEGFTFGGALAGIVSQLPVTFPAAVAVSIAATLNVLAGAVVLRLARRTAYHSWSDLVLAGFGGAVLLDALLVFVLGGVGLFRPVVLAAVLLVVCLAGLGARPLVALSFGVDRSNFARGLLVALVWCGPLLVALASPVVPAADVLPNHVAPAEHLRVFGSIASLATYPSPIYGASRLFLGYSALMGTLATLTGLPAALAVAAFTGPLLVISAVAVRRLAGVAFGREAGFWALLAFPLAFTFVRLPDVRDSVVALPLAALTFALLLVPDRVHSEIERAGRPDWLLAAALTAATLVHPLVGVLTAGSVAILTMADPARLARRAIPALLATAVAVSPQLAVMIGLEPAPLLGLVAFVAAVFVALVAAASAERVAWSRIEARWATAVTIVAGGLVVLAIVVGVPDALGQASQSLNPAFPVLFAAAVLAAVGLAPTSRGGRRLLLASLAAGGGALLLVAAVPDSLLVGQSLRYEVPKAVGYWLPWACVPAAAGLVAAVARGRDPAFVRPALVGAFLAVVLLSIGSPAPDSAQASHAVADGLAHDLRTAELGFWQGYPDVRLVVDASGRQVLAFLRQEVSGGRLGADSQLLHVAASYQGSTSLPIADFTGIEETMVCADATTNIFTAGGRIYPVASLAAELHDGFAYVVLEPADLPRAVRAAIIAAGYRSVFANTSAEVFVAPA